MNSETWNLRNGLLQRQFGPGLTDSLDGEAKGDDCSNLPTGCRILRASEGVHYWQVQYYPEHLTSELDKCAGASSFEQTLRGIDETFYATFPDARHPSGRQWSHYSISDNVVHEGTAFLIHDAISVTYPSHLNPSLSAQAMACDSEVVQQPTFSSELISAVQPSDVGPAQKDCSQPFQSLAMEFDEEPQQMVGIESHQTDISMSSPTRQMSVETDRVTHIQERKPLSMQSSVDDEPPMACLSPPPNDDLLPIKQESSPIQDLNRLPSQTGTWPSLRTRSQSQADSSPPPTTTSSPSETVSLTSFGRRTSLLPASPTTSSATSPPSPIGTNSTSRTESEVAGPSVMRLSPLPTNRKPVEKKKTQTLACTFCRHRKIACGPPRSGTTEKTCNQCQRRSLECVFPTESRRGMRKKKAQPSQKTPGSPDSSNATNQSVKSEQKHDLPESGSSHRPQEDG